MTLAALLKQIEKMKQKYPESVFAEVQLMQYDGTDEVRVVDDVFFICNDHQKVDRVVIA
jgi:hypothetical protein